MIPMIVWCVFVFMFADRSLLKIEVAVCGVILRTTEIKVFAYSIGVASGALGLPIPIRGPKHLPGGRRKKKEERGKEKEENERRKKKAERRKKKEERRKKAEGGQAGRNGGR